MCLWVFTSVLAIWPATFGLKKTSCYKYSYEVQGLNSYEQKKKICLSAGTSLRCHFHVVLRHIWTQGFFWFALFLFSLKGCEESYVSAFISLVLFPNSCWKSVVQRKQCFPRLGNDRPLLSWRQSWESWKLTCSLDRERQLLMTSVSRRVRLWMSTCS